MFKFDLFSKRNNVILSTTGAGKTTLLSDLFLAKYHKNSFRVHFKPDPERIQLYKKLNIPFVKTKEEVIETYLVGNLERVVWDIEPKFVTGIDPYIEFLVCVHSILQYKELIMRDGSKDTNECYLFLDEAQHSMSSHSIPEELESVILEGRKYGLWIGVVTQRPALINQVAKTQSNIIVGFMEGEHYWQKQTERPIPNEFYNFIVRFIDGSHYLLEGKETTIKELRANLKN